MPSAKWWLVERAKLARMQAGPDSLELFHRRDADADVLGYRALVEAIGHARELDFAVQRFVRDAEERPVRNAKAVALRRDRARLHVNRNGA